MIAFPQWKGAKLVVAGVNRFAASLGLLTGPVAYSRVVAEPFRDFWTERPALWDARRLASAWHAASSRAERVLSAAPVRLSALRPPLIGVAQVHNPGANAPRE